MTCWPACSTTLTITLGILFSCTCINRQKGGGTSTGRGLSAMAATATRGTLASESGSQAGSLSALQAVSQTCLTRDTQTIARGSALHSQNICFQVCEWVPEENSLFCLNTQKTEPNLSFGTDLNQFRPAFLTLIS